MTIPSPKLSTLGCRLNAYETEAMRELATSSGVSDAVIINTCAVTAEAVRKSKQEVRKLRKENPGAKVIVTGCAAQIDPNSFASMAEVDFVIGNSEKMAKGIFSLPLYPELKNSEINKIISSIIKVLKKLN